MANKDIEHIWLPPWNSPNIKVHRVKLERKKDEYSKDQLRDLTEETIAKIDADVKVFTDGSTSGQQTNGGAGFVALDRYNQMIYEESKPAGMFCSSYDGECVAMISAINWITAFEAEAVNNQTQPLPHNGRS